MVVKACTPLFLLSSYFKEFLSLLFNWSAICCSFVAYFAALLQKLFKSRSSISLHFPLRPFIFQFKTHLNFMHQSKYSLSCLTSTPPLPYRVRRAWHFELLNCCCHHTHRKPKQLVAIQPQATCFNLARTALEFKSKSKTMAKSKSMANSKSKLLSERGIIEVPHGSGIHTWLPVYTCLYLSFLLSLSA